MNVTLGAGYLEKTAGRTFWRIIKKKKTVSGGYFPAATATFEELQQVGTLSLQAGDLVASKTPIKDWHLPVLDIDFEAHLVPSSTPGHYHLFLNQPIPWREYRRLLKALARAGIVEKDWVKSALSHGMSMVRAT